MGKVMVEADLEDSYYLCTEYLSTWFAKVKAFLSFQRGSLKYELHGGGKTEKVTGRRLLVRITWCNTMTFWEERFSIT